MCGRYAFFSPHEAVLRYFELPESTAALEPRFNIAPTQQVASVRASRGAGRELALLHWGLVPAWAKERSIGSRMINARAETLAEKPAFRSAYKQRRCLVLADGYYEWRVTASGKQPYFIRRADGQPFGMAGLWEYWPGGGGVGPLASCVIVTQPASPELCHIHLRMPAIIPHEAHATWLDPAQTDTGSLSQLLQSDASPALTATAVSRRVNNPAQQGAELLEAVAEP